MEFIRRAGHTIYMHISVHQVGRNPYGSERCFTVVVPKCRACLLPALPAALPFPTHPNASLPGPRRRAPPSPAALVSAPVPPELRASGPPPVLFNRARFVGARRGTEHVLRA